LLPLPLLPALAVAALAIACHRCRLHTFLAKAAGAAASTAPLRRLPSRVRL